MMAERGFTLIEILVALSIMLVLVLVAVPRFVGASPPRRDTLD